MPRWFQFRHGAIKTFDRKCQGKLTVSFQFRHGAIKTHHSAAALQLYLWFQFRHGAIKTQPGGQAICPIPVSIPTRCDQNRRAQVFALFCVPRFNSDTVRSKPGHGRCLCPCSVVSIPTRCDQNVACTTFVSTSPSVSIPTRCDQNGKWYMLNETG